MRRPLNIGGVCLLLVALLGSPARAGQDWPQIALPPGATSYNADAVSTVNGTPMKMQGFVVPTATPELAAWFRRSLGKPLVENMLGPKLVLGQLRGEYFVTVQLEAAAGGTRALLAIAHLKAGLDQRHATAGANARLIERLPAGTRLESRLGSTDNGKQASHVTLSNQHSVQINRERLVRMLAEDGLRLEREAKADAPLPPGLRESSTLFFKGSRGEAMAVIARRTDGNTTIVMNTTTPMEHFK